MCVLKEISKMSKMYFSVRFLIDFAYRWFLSDGTCITTAYTIEEQLVTCEWSKDELQRYFGLSETNDYDSGSTRASPIDNLDQDSPVSESSYREKLTSASITDGFVSISLTFRIEHKDYATVSYDQSAERCILSMSDDLCVSISRSGHYEVSMGSEVNLKVIKARLVTCFR